MFNLTKCFANIRYTIRLSNNIPNLLALRGEIRFNFREIFKIDIGTKSLLKSTIITFICTN